MIYQNDIALGTLVTQVFHDHTSLRIPRPPRIYAIRETDPVHIAQAIIHSNPAESEAWIHRSNEGNQSNEHCMT
ncbi:DUF6022 family protein [Paenibacillus allorhizosphaerae]|uniref:DUF6022 family protein n=1 Tax=Paenibacillus allorhizosphaerae TaxID=2849866 RepID=UPI001C404B95|nr:DUF6022 family protein [Paenibacillus allorhizosphaerae]